MSSLPLNNTNNNINTEELRQMFEYELHRKISIRAKTSTAEQMLLVNAFRFNDIKNTGFVNKTDWIKVFGKIGLSGFDENKLNILFDIYDSTQSGLIDYKNFTQYLYNLNQLIPVSKEAANHINNVSNNNVNNNIFSNPQEAIAEKAIQDSKININLNNNNNNFNQTNNNNNLRFNVRNQRNSSSISFIFGGDENVDKKNNNNKNLNNNNINNNNIINQPVNNNNIRINNNNIQPERTNSLNFSFNNNNNNNNQNQINMNNNNIINNDNINNNINNLNNMNNVNKPLQTPNSMRKYFQTLLSEFRAKINTNYGITYYNLVNKLKSNEDPLKKSISFSSFLKSLLDSNIQIPEVTIQHFYSSVDLTESNNVNVEEILRLIRGELNEKRKLIIVEVFAGIDYEKKGFTEINNIKNIFNSKGHPLCVIGVKNENEIYDQFNFMFDSFLNFKDINARFIDFEQFIEFYEGISASYFNDEEFKNYMNGVWSNVKNLNNNNNNNNNNVQNNNFKNNNNNENNIFPFQNNNNNNENPRPHKKYYNKSNINIFSDEYNKNNVNHSGKRVTNRQQFSQIKDLLQFENNINLNDNNLFNRRRPLSNKITTINNNNQINNSENNINNDNQNNINFNNTFALRGKNNNLNNKPTYNPITQEYFIPDNNNNNNNNINNNQNVNNNNQNVNNNNQNVDFINTNNQNVDFINNNNQNVNDINIESINRNINNLMKNNANNINFNINREINNNNSNEEKNNNFKAIPNNNININNDKFVPSPQFINITNNNEFQDSNDNINPIIVSNANENIIPKISAPDFGNISNSTNSIELVLKNLRNILITRGTKSIFILQKMFNLYDKNNKGLIDFINFEKICQTFKLNISNDEITKIFQTFSIDYNNRMNYDNFIYTLRGQLSPMRLELVRNAFNKLPINNFNNIRIEDLKSNFNASNHPDVVSGKQIKEMVFNEFVEELEIFREYEEKIQKKPLMYFQFQDFVNFYTQISMGITDDNYFENLITSVWNVDANNLMYKNNNPYSNYNNYYSNNKNINQRIRTGTQVVSSFNRLF